MKPNSPKSIGITAVFVLALGTISVHAAQNNPNPDITRRELLNFDGFLDSHAAIDQELQKKPGLVNDPAYVKAHPELKEFLENHPGVKEEIRETPRYFMGREERFDASGRDITRGEVRSMDEFLDGHPAVEKELAKHPGLIDDPKYIARHPELAEYLNHHPRVKQEIRENPRAFMNREKRLEKLEKRENREARERNRAEHPKLARG